MTISRGGAGRYWGGLLDGRFRDQYDMICFHDYYEGMLRTDIFESFLSECKMRGMMTVSLRETAEKILGEGVRLPYSNLVRSTVPGYIGEVSCQNPL